MDFLFETWRKAKENQSRIVLPEAMEPRTLKAADIVIREQLAQIILLGNIEEIKTECEKQGYTHILEKATIIDPPSSEYKDEYAKLVTTLRESKGMTYDKAFELLNDPLYYAVAMIKSGHADGEVAGAQNATGDVLRPAFQLLKTKPGISIVSGVFIMILPDKEFGDDGVMIFADCAVNPDPDERILTEIAITTADTTRELFNMTPKIAMLSFSTKGSANHYKVDKVANAVSRVKEMRPDIIIDGEMQLDAAISPEVCKKKAPDSIIAGKANVLIFPSLEAGNIAYKLVQRFAHADAFGPILQGLAAPVNDLSRGCFVRDIVNVVAITANQAAESKKIKPTFTGENI